MRVITALSVWMVLAGAGVQTARAQNAQPTPAPKPAPPRVRISANAGIQPSTHEFTSATTRAIYAENGIVNTTYDVGSGPFFDGGALIRLAGGLHAGVAVSSFAKQSDGDISAAIPHPFFYNTPRAVTGVAPGLEQRELATHLQAAYLIPAGKKIDIAVSVGPSWFHVSQDLVTGVTFTERYPYDTATFSSATTTSASVTAVGVNAGVDVGVKLSKNVGVGGLLRYSHTSVEFPLTGATTNPKSDVGGIQAGGGVRLYF